MSRGSCPFEDAVRNAARSGRWTPDLEVHRDGCMTCAEMTLVVAALTMDAESLVRDDLPVPDPGFLWLRSRVADRQGRFERATRAIVWLQRVTVAAAAAIGVAFVPNLWGLLQRSLAALDLGAAAGLPRSAGSPTLVLAACVLVLGWLAFSELSALPKS